MRSSRTWRGAFSGASPNSLPSISSPPRMPPCLPLLSSRARLASGRRRSCAPRWLARLRPGLRVLLARPAAGEAELPYVGLGDLLGGFDAGAFASLAGPQREAIEAALARGGAGESGRAARAFARAAGVPPERRGGGRPADRHRRRPVARPADRLGAVVCAAAARAGAGARARRRCGRTAAAQLSRSRFPTGACSGSRLGRCRRRSWGR